MKKQSYIIVASWVSIAGNALLAVLKLIIGFISGSYAVIADGIDSSSDILSSVVTLIAAKIVTRPPNIKYPYGYVKADAVATKVLSMFIFIAGAQLAISSVKNLIGESPTELPSYLAIYVTLFSILGKIFLSIYLKRVGKNHNSNMLITMGKHMRNDMLISVSVLIGLLSAIIFDVPVIDKVVALIISIVIITEAVKIFLKTNVELMDGIDDPQLYKEIFNAICCVDGAYTPHRTRARKIGSYLMINTDIEVDPNLSVKEAHDIAKKVENSIKEKIENVYDVMVHIEPMGNLESDEKFGISEKDINQ